MGKKKKKKRVEVKSIILSAKDEDIINKPLHYNTGSIEPIDYILANDLSFTEGNIIKYVTRYKYKNGLEDLKKAKFYLNKLIETYK